MRLKLRAHYFLEKLWKSSLPIEHGFIQGLILIQIILCNNSDKERLFFVIFWFRLNMKTKFEVRVYEVGLNLNILLYAKTKFIRY